MAVWKADEPIHCHPRQRLIKSLHLAASEPPTNTICVWNTVRCASGSSIPIKITLGPANVWGITASIISCEKGVENSLGGVRSSVSSCSRCPWLLFDPVGHRWLMTSAEDNHVDHS